MDKSKDVIVRTLKEIEKEVSCSCGWQGKVGQMEYDMSLKGNNWVCPKCGVGGKLRLRG